jgi:DNA helicase II / ATP-dependent DNA helicase PcrA
MSDDSLTPAESASQRALEAMFRCLEENKSFRLEAGAGAGKTYSLIKALRHLIECKKDIFPKLGQQIACITFTNVAKSEIEARTDQNPLVYCGTNHAFCWALISGFQKQLRVLVEALPSWQEKLAEVGGSLGTRSVDYSLGYRSLREDRANLHHDDVLPLTISLMQHDKFRRMIAERFPIILVDEYQDTDNDWIEAIKALFLGKEGSPLFGFFGDHWQKIYGEGCGRLDHPAVLEIGKQANFRSVATVIDCLNRMRPELQQFAEKPDSVGEVRVFHTNHWTGDRQKGGHWGGDLPSEIGHQTYERTKELLVQQGWDFSYRHTKILILTHRLLASEQGYSGLASVFRYKESYTKKDHPYIAFFVDELEPASDWFYERKFGKMFEALGGTVPLVRRHSDKVAWNKSMELLEKLRETGTIGEVIDHLQGTRKPRLPDAIHKLERDLHDFAEVEGEALPNTLDEIRKLRSVPYQEVKALRKYLDGHSPFETKHGVKGAEFENVLIVFGRGWNNYNFGEMLELANRSPIPPARADAFERNRNLFYVACSRPKTRLALLFTQKLSPEGMATLQQWFSPAAIYEAPLP